MNRTKREIVFVNQASGYLTIDIVNAFCSDFDEVSLISSSVRIQEIPLNSKVKVYPTLKHSRSSNISRLFRWVVASIHIFFLLATKYRKYDIFYISIPPMAYLSSLFLPNKFSVLIYDVYPDVLDVFGITNRNPLYIFWSWANKKIFKKAHKIYTISDGMKIKLEQYVFNNNVHVVYNWTGVNNLSPINPTDNIFIKQEGLDGKFVVQYSGNISPTHNVEVLVKVAEQLKNEKDIIFLIIGRGQLVDSVESLITKLNLNENIRMLPYQPDEILKHSLSSADLGVVVVGSKVSELSIPSKIYNIQACGVPILGIGPKGSELDNHLALYNNGIFYDHEDVSEIANMILSIKNHPSHLQQLKQNSLKAAKDFTKENAKMYLDIYNN